MFLSSDHCLGQALTHGIDVWVVCPEGGGATDSRQGSFAEILRSILLRPRPTLILVPSGHEEAVVRDGEDGGLSFVRILGEPFEVAAFAAALNQLVSANVNDEEVVRARHLAAAREIASGARRGRHSVNAVLGHVERIVGVLDRNPEYIDRELRAAWVRTSSYFVGRLEELHRELVSVGSLISAIAAPAQQNVLDSVTDELAGACERMRAFALAHWRWSEGTDQTDIAHVAKSGHDFLSHMRSLDAQLQDLMGADAIS